MRRAVSMMSCIVSAFTFDESPDRARDTVDFEMQSSLAISFMVMYFEIVWLVLAICCNYGANLAKVFYL